MMRKINGAKVCATIVALCLCLCVLLSTGTAASVYAGASKLYVISDSSVTENIINTGDFLAEGNIYAEDGVVIFDEKSSKNARLLAKAHIGNFKKYGVTSLLEASFTIEIDRLAEGGKVSVLFGLNKTKYGSGSADSAEIVFINDNGLCIGVNEYKKENEKTEVSPATKYSSLPLTAAIEMNLKIESNGKIYLTAECDVTESGTIDILKGKRLSIDPAGYLAFASYSSDTEKNEVKLWKMSALAYNYEVVSTVEHYLETFDNGYNANMFYSAARQSIFAPSGIYVEDGCLVFKDCGPAHFTTMERYSNFELKFDIVDLAREGIVDDNGHVLQRISNWFMIGFGIDSYTSEDYSTATMLQFEHLPMSVGNGNDTDHVTGEGAKYSNRYVLWVNGKAETITSMSTSDGSRWSVYDAKKVGTQMVNVKYVVKDGTINLYYKLASETDYGEPQFSYDIGTCDSGYVRIYTYGNQSSDGSDPENKCASVLNMKIDNFEITSLDYGASNNAKPAPEFSSNLSPRMENFDYTTVTDPSDLLNNKLKG